MVADLHVLYQTQEGTQDVLLILDCYYLKAVETSSKEGFGQGGL